MPQTPASRPAEPAMPDTDAPATVLQALEAALRDALGDSLRSLVVRLGEITVEIDPAMHEAVALRLRDDPRLRFDTMIDLCGVDYAGYRDGGWEGKRFAVVLHLLSVERNQRVRVRSFCADDEFPVIASVTGVWPTADWFEREAFDLYGIVFEGHPDLRRILTDYGFVGHPIPERLPRQRLRRDALRPRTAARDLPAGHDPGARDRAAGDPRRGVRAVVRRTRARPWLTSRTIPSTLASAGRLRRP